MAEEPLTEEIASRLAEEVASHATVRASTYQKGWLKFYKKRDFVRKSFGCQDLQLVIFCIVSTWPA